MAVSEGLFPNPIKDQEDAAARAGVDLGDGYPLPLKEGQTVVGKVGKKSAEKLDWEYHNEAFTVFRPWENCDRCKQRIMSQLVELPEEEGDLVCPHTNKKLYERVINDAREPDKAIVGRSAFTSLKDGTMIAQVEWWQHKERDKGKKRSDEG